jgi:hypothetical protein
VSTPTYSVANWVKIASGGYTQWDSGLGGTLWDTEPPAQVQARINSPVGGTIWDPNTQALNDWEKQP